MTAIDPVVIVAYARTPMGGFQGVFRNVPATALGARAVEASVEKAGIARSHISEVILGNVLSAGLGQAPARQAAIAAGVPNSVECTTINKMCGSGMKAVMLAHDLITAGTGTVYVAGGMESMTGAPYLLSKARGGYRIGHGELVDHMFLDGLEDAYEKGRLMGTFAEECAEAYGFSRDQQDDFAASSLQRAQRAINDGSFSREVSPVEVSNNGYTELVTEDEQPLKASVEKIQRLKPAFKANGTVTAANSSGIADGAAAVVLMRLSEAERHGLTPLASIVGHAGFAGHPAMFTTAPVFAIRGLLDKTGWDMADVDLVEINEAFAVVALAAMRELRLPHEKLNVHGGACALGHPIGASGARILVTLLAAMTQYGFGRGVAALCIGGGEATAMAVEIFR